VISGRSLALCHGKCDPDHGRCPKAEGRGTQGGGDGGRPSRRAARWDGNALFIPSMQFEENRGNSAQADVTPRGSRAVGRLWGGEADGRPVEIEAERPRREPTSDPRCRQPWATTAQASSPAGARPGLGPRSMGKPAVTGRRSASRAWRTSGSRTMRPVSLPTQGWRTHGWSVRDHPPDHFLRRL
jgi:hypothetical protein